MRELSWFHVEFYFGSYSNKTVVREVVVAAHSVMEARDKAKADCPLEAADGRLGCMATRHRALTKAESWSERHRNDVS